MFDDAITSILLRKGQELFDGPREPIAITKDAEADRLLNDIDGHPHAFTIACIMDRQMKAELAWLVPFRLAQRLGDFCFSSLERLSLEDLVRYMSQPEPLHRFPNEMARNVHDAIGLISSRHGGDAARIWRGRPSSGTVVLRFLEFRGVGPKIATMAANILARELKVPLSDYYSVDISVDVHVRRVFGRLGLVAQGASAEVITYTARAISPQFPGVLDYPAFEIGRAWCRPRNPACGECTMFAVCPSANR